MFDHYLSDHPPVPSLKSIFVVLGISLLAALFALVPRYRVARLSIARFPGTLRRTRFTLTCSWHACAAGGPGAGDGGDRR